MVHIIISMLTVSANAIEVRESIEELYHGIEMLICIKISRICFLDLFSMGIEDFVFGDNSHFNKLSGGELHAVLIGHIPEVVPLGTEILKAYPNCILRLFHHIRRPVVEYLYSAKLYALILNVYSAVRDDIAESCFICFIFKVELIDQQTNGNKVTVWQTLGYLYDGIARLCAVHAEDKVFDRH